MECRHLRLDNGSQIVVLKQKEPAVVVFLGEQIASFRSGGYILCVSVGTLGASRRVRGASVNAIAISIFETILLIPSGTLGSEQTTACERTSGGTRAACQAVVKLPAGTSCLQGAWLGATHQKEVTQPLA